jgi:hypothetical protein
VAFHGGAPSAVLSMMTEIARQNARGIDLSSSAFIHDVDLNMQALSI